MTFREKTYVFIRQIPKGMVATYSQVARGVGSPHAARAVGMAMKTNPDAPKTPCHRVVAADGRLTGYSGVGGVAGKKAMLLREGVQFIGERVDLSVSQWKEYV